MKKIICFSIGLFLLAACESGQRVGETKAIEHAEQPYEAVATARNLIRYDTYCNERYHYCIDYPKDYLVPQGESGSGDGQAFVSTDGTNQLLAYRDLRDNIDPDIKFSIKTAYDEDLKDENIKEVTYKKLGNGFYVITGYNKKGSIFYQKSIIREGQLITCELEYREADKELFDQISEHVFHSFK